ncbi:MAG: hypothetical protein MUO28_03750 [Desulfobacterales bacterium]|nr:hypothetical protein [Desulfobacterales bacterium]
MIKRLVLVIVCAMGLSVRSFAQFTAGEITEREKWEAYLSEAEVVDYFQMTGPKAVSDPWVLTLEKDGVKSQALWKDVQGRPKGFLENWKGEIAAYRLDKLIGLEMVPPTVEKRFREERGSCQLWMDDTMTMEDKLERKIATPKIKIFNWNRALYKQYLWDNLIGNDDRHQNQYLVTDDFRILLCDHSRSFLTSRAFTNDLIYDERHKKGPGLMKELPRSLYENVKALTLDKIKEAVGDYLTAKEIEAVLMRRDLIVTWIEKRIEELGELNVLY